MKLYYSPAACSLSPHIVLHEVGLPFEAVRVSTKTHQTADGGDYYAINPLGYVPLLVLDDGTQLAEGPAIVQYLADQAPDKALAPANGTLARAQLQSALNFISTELHKGFGPLFNPAYDANAKAVAKAQLEKRLGWMNEQLASKPYVMGAQYSVADAYLFTVTGWGGYVGVDINQWPHLVAHRARVGERPAVQAALKAEGLLKA